MSQISRISGLFRSSQVLGVNPALAMQPNGWVMKLWVKPIASARCGVGFSAKARSTLLACRSSTEEP